MGTEGHETSSGERVRENGQGPESGRENSRSPRPRTRERLRSNMLPQERRKGEREGNKRVSASGRAGPSRQEQATKRRHVAAEE